jgi:hypothetical protein
VERLGMLCNVEHARKLPRLYVAAGISQRLVSYQLIEKNVWTVSQFQMFVQWSHIPVQLDIVKYPL